MGFSAGDWLAVRVATPFLDGGGCNQRSRPAKRLASSSFSSECLRRPSAKAAAAAQEVEFEELPKPGALWVVYVLGSASSCGWQGPKGSVVAGCNGNCGA
ncbi:hypothetical protein Agub_g12492, partial [Astrephomene gubernaculifera]